MNAFICVRSFTLSLTYLAQISRNFFTMLPMFNFCLRNVTFESPVAVHVRIIRWRAARAVVVGEIAAAVQHDVTATTAAVGNLFQSNGAKLIRFLFEKPRVSVRQHKHRVVHQSRVRLYVNGNGGWWPLVVA